MGLFSDRLYCAAKLHARTAHPLRQVPHNYKAKLKELSIHELTFQKNHAQGKRISGSYLPLSYSSSFMMIYSNL
jgi:hypothetical protein